MTIKRKIQLLLNTFNRLLGLGVHEEDSEELIDDDYR